MRLNLPNSLTLARMLLVPPMVAAMLLPDSGPLGAGARDIVAAALFLLASLTDFLDGYLARSQGLVTDFGKLLDPIADKLLVGSALVALVGMGRASALAVIIILGREFAVSGIRSFAATRGLVIAAAWWGKIKMVVQIVAITILMLQQALAPTIPQIATIGRVVLWAAVATALISLTDYVVRFRHQLGVAAR